VEPDAPLDPSKLPGARSAAQLPHFVSPQLATLVEDVPIGDTWSHEVKFDGYRALLRVEDGTSEIRSRNDKNWTGAYQLIADDAAKLPVQSAMLDGEVVVQAPDGTTKFEELRHVARVAGAGVARRGGPEGPGGVAGRLVYYAFDLLFLDGYDLLDVGIEQRRDLLRRLLQPAKPDGRILFSDDIRGDGAAVLAQACGLGLEGVVSKKTGGRYKPGVRGPEWVKTKCRHEQEFVIGGFTDPAGTRVGFGALLLGVYENGALRYVSKVGTGFDERLLRSLGPRLRALEVGTPPFAQGLPKESARESGATHWVRPELVAQVSFLEWTSGGGIRHGSFKGLREDKPAIEVVAEIPGTETSREGDDHA
jgi:bifunctional non-homologous end joining protein LigD